MCMVAAGCGSDEPAAGTASGTTGTIRAAAAEPCPPVSGASSYRMVVRNETQWPMVTRATNWTCTDSDGKFRYSGEATPGVLDALRVEPGAEATRTIDWRWEWRGTEGRESDGYWWLGRFQFALYQDIGGRLQVVPIAGLPAMPLAMNARLTRLGPKTWGFRPVSKPWVRCPVVVPLNLVGGEAAKLTVACPSEDKQRGTTTITVGPR